MAFTAKMLCMLTKMIHKYSTVENGKTWTVLPNLVHECIFLLSASFLFAQIYAHTCKIWINLVWDRTYLKILDMMKSLEKGDSSGHMPTWAELHVAKLSRTRRPAKNMLNNSKVRRDSIYFLRNSRLSRYCTARGWSKRFWWDSGGFVHAPKKLPLR